jgi:hypothetical protein
MRIGVKIRMKAARGRASLEVTNSMLRTMAIVAEVSKPPMSINCRERGLSKPNCVNAVNPAPMKRA